MYPKSKRNSSGMSFHELGTVRTPVRPASAINTIDEKGVRDSLWLREGLLSGGRMRSRTTQPRQPSSALGRAGVVGKRWLERTFPSIPPSRIYPSAFTPFTNVLRFIAHIKSTFSSITCNLSASRHPLKNTLAAANRRQSIIL
jgi:hypothetical protein